MARHVTITFREDERNEAHVRVSVFVGRNPGARGHSGQLVLRTDEWDEARVWLDTLGDDRHMLRLTEDDWHLTHAPMCRPDLNACRVLAATEAYLDEMGGPWCIGDLEVWLDGDGTFCWSPQPEEALGG